MKAQPARPEDLLDLIRKAFTGDQAALDRFEKQALPEIRRMAEAKLRRANTKVRLVVQPTVLVNELIRTILESSSLKDAERGFGANIIARKLKHVFHDLSRKLEAEKRGGKMNRVHVDTMGWLKLNNGSSPDYLDLHRELETLEQQHPRVGQVVNLKFFAELTMPEIAKALGIALRTAEADWSFAKAWLYRKLGS